MADNYNIEELLSLVFGKDEASESSQNFTSDEVEHANPEAEHHEIQGVSSLESDRNFSASSFSREPRVAASLPTLPSISGYEYSFDIPSSYPLAAGAEQSIFAAPEENPLNSFLVPVVASRGDFCRTNDTQSYPSEQSSFQHNIGWNSQRPGPWKKPGNTHLGYENSTFINNPEEFFSQLKPSHSDSASPPQMSTERDRYEATAQTKEDYIQLSTDAMSSQIEDIPNMEVATNRGSLGSFEGAETVLAGGPSGIQTQSRGTGKDKLHVCDICGKALATKYSLKDHMNKHTGDKPYQCTFCAYSSAYKANLTTHLRTHTGAKPFECTFCAYSSAYKSNLTTHLRTHTGAKPFECTFCTYSSAHKGNLTTHLRTHTGAKPFECKFCTYSSAQKSNLTTHLRTHIGAKPFQCNFCSYSSAHESHLATHLRTHT